MAILWAFKDNCGLGFFKGSLMKDPDGLLVRPGDNSRAAMKLPFRSVEEIAGREDVIRAYVGEAVEIERLGLKVDLPRDDLSPPGELVQALASDAALKAAYDVLTPGRRRSWILHVAQAKQSATRAARIAKARPRILDGKGQSER